MTASPNRATIGILSISLFTSSTYLLSKYSFAAVIPKTAHADLIIGIIYTFNIAIILAWASLGRTGAIAIASLSAIVVFWLALKARHPGYILYSAPFAISTIIGYWPFRTMLKLDAIHALKLEKLNEKANLLSNDIQVKQRGIHSLESKLERYSTLKDAIESLSTSLSLDEINNLIIEKTVKTLGKSGRVLFYLVDMERQELKLSASGGEERIMAKTGDAFDRWIMRHRTSLIIEDVTKDFRFAASDVEMAKEIFSSLIAAPLVAENKVIGVLRMDDRMESSYGQDDLRLLDIIADLGAVTVQNALLYSRTQELAIKDSLTGLFVRRFFLERFGQELKRTAMNKGELSLLMMDIDHFKDYNDKFGHAAGDLVLKHIGRIINSVVREGDIIGRYGGEEIAVLLCGRTKESAAVEAEKILKVIKDNPLMLRRNKTNVTISIGASSYPKDAISEESMIKIADARLYKAKAEGRGRVCSA